VLRNERKAPCPFSPLPSEEVKEVENVARRVILFMLYAGLL
jgi:hypothetical protein